jgi:hypothetical protein
MRTGDPPRGPAVLPQRDLRLETDQARRLPTAGRPL